MKYECRLAVIPLTVVSLRFSSVLTLFSGAEVRYFTSRYYHSQLYHTKEQVTPLVV